MKEGPSSSVIRSRSQATHLVNGPPQAQLESSTREVLAGLVERVTFHNAENGFCVLGWYMGWSRALIEAARPPMGFVMPDDEAMQIKLEPVLHSGTVDLGYQPAGFGERGPIKAYPVPDIDQLVRRLP